MLRLRTGGTSKRKIAASLSIGMTTAGEAIRRARRAGMSWPLREGLGDEALERLYSPRLRLKSCRRTILLRLMKRSSGGDWPNSLYVFAT